MIDPTDLYAKVAVATPPKKGVRYIPDGTHKLALANYYQKNGENGLVICADFVVMESTVLPPGTVVGHSWRMYLTSWKYDNELGSMRVFTECLGGLKDQGQLQQYGARLLSENIGRGRLITAVGIRNSTDTWTDITWRDVPGQTPEITAQVLGYIAPLAAPRPAQQMAPAYAPPPPKSAVAYAPAPVAQQAYAPAPVAQQPAPLLPQAAPPAATPAPAAPAAPGVPFPLP